MSEEIKINGIHHVTAIADDPRRNVEFYVEALGLRLVKRTVNFDAPETYHLYYGDRLGSPGSIMTFFPWPGMPRGRRGVGQATVVSFAVPRHSLGFWIDRLKSNGVTTEKPRERFEEEYLTLYDPDGLKLELVASGSSGFEPWESSPVPPQHAIGGFHGVTLAEQGYEATSRLLTHVLGFGNLGEDGNRFRYGAGSGSADVVDLVCTPDAPPGRISVGTVHHVAWRTSGPSEQLAWRNRLVEQGLNVTPVLDRNYFQSIYFREPGGVLFEIATDPPGFAVDEDPDRLGAELKLPPWLEESREALVRVLPPLDRVERKA